VLDKKSTASSLGLIGWRITWPERLAHALRRATPRVRASCVRHRGGRFIGSSPSPFRSRGRWRSWERQAGTCCLRGRPPRCPFARDAAARAADR
jgi:hypothetical protein